MINANLSELCVNFTCNLTSDMNDYEIQSSGGELDFPNLSLGEQMKLIISSQLAFRRFLMSRFNVCMNIMIIDEVVDRALDSVSIQKLLGIRPLDKSTFDSRQPTAVTTKRQTTDGSNFQLSTSNFQLPLMGICLGHQLLALACGAKTARLKFGHHGCNHPVKNLATGKVEITSQNHNFAVVPESVPECLEVTHVNLNDNSIEGIRHKTLPAFSVQYHPESCPGPHDSNYLFEEFRRMVCDNRQPASDDLCRLSSVVSP